MKTIVVGYDETEPSKRALERAAGFAKAFGSKVVVTSVAPTLHAAGGRSAGPIDPTDTPEMHAEELSHARTYLAEQGVDAEFATGLGEADEAILEAAARHGAELIVVGSRELGLVQRMLGLSVSQAVSRHAECDVLIVH